MCKRSGIYEIDVTLNYRHAGNSIASQLKFCTKNTIYREWKFYGKNVFYGVFNTRFAVKLQEDEEWYFKFDKGIGLAMVVGQVKKQNPGSYFSIKPLN